MTRAALGIVMVALMIGQACQIRAQEAVRTQEIEGAVVHLSDLAALPETMADPVVARVGEGETRLELSADSVSAILRRYAPDAGLLPRFAGRHSFVRRQVADGARDAPAQCRVLNQPAPRGTFIDTSMLTTAPCREEEHRDAAIAYDRDARALVATADMAAGTVLGRLDPGNAPAPLPAEAPLRLRVRSGPVVIDREVRTLQAGRPGDRVFVVTSQGDVIVAEIAEEMAEERTAS